MNTVLDLGGLSVDVVFKDIKNVHLSVYPPTGRVRISAPAWMHLEAIRLFAISKLDWIKKKQAKLLAQERETKRDNIERESHYLWGKRYLMSEIEHDAPSGLHLTHEKMIMCLRPQTTEDQKQAIVAQFYRDQIKAEAPPIIAKWTPLVGVGVSSFHVQKMRTKWGSCNPLTRSIRLNTELAKKPRYCLEYVVVHEMTHFLEGRHGDRFVALMDKFLPQWRIIRDELNALPLGHEDWNK